jgi:putative flavoprotein involved in K+ transport
VKNLDVIVIGAGQSGLAAGYYLRKTGLSFLILDDQQYGGGGWQHTWKSLRLFSPAQWSSLPGTLMNGGGSYYPTRDETIAYLRDYEKKYDLPVQRPVKVNQVSKEHGHYILETSAGDYVTKAVVSATGTYRNPYAPQIEDSGSFHGTIIHSTAYNSPVEFLDKRVAVVGAGNSGAQILAELSRVTETLWITRTTPRFLPDHVDGRFLFDVATQLYEAKKQGNDFKVPSLGDIVMVDSVKDARQRNVLKSFPSFERFTEDGLRWEDGREEKVDAVIFCTGFRPSLNHVSSLGIINRELKVDTEGTRAKNIGGLWFVGYGNWTGFASATLIGVGRSAKTAVEEIALYVAGKNLTSPSFLKSPIRF